MRTLNRPVSWWGWHWTPPLPMSIVEILRAGSVSPRLAALFWLALQRGASLIVAAEPPLAGKTTILTALLAFAPPDSLAYFTRGIGESFDLPPLDGSHPTYLLINEMSDHLPVYTWGPYARRAFDLLEQGYSLASTVHANSAAEVIAILEKELAIPRRQIANLNFIISLHVGYRGAPMRRVQEVVFLSPDSADGLSVRWLARWNREDDSFSLLQSPEDKEALARWAGLSTPGLEEQLQERAGFLRRLLDDGTTEIGAVQQAVEAFYRRQLRGEPGKSKGPG